MILGIPSERIEKSLKDRHFYCEIVYILNKSGDFSKTNSNTFY